VKKGNRTLFEPSKTTEKLGYTKGMGNEEDIIPQILIGPREKGKVRERG